MTNVTEGVIKDNLIALGQVVVGKRGDHYDLADPNETCMHRMRPWTEPIWDWKISAVSPTPREHFGYCLMDLNHNGRHATVVFTCDGCDKTRRGSPHTSINDPCSLCWFCLNVGNRYNALPRRKKKLKREVTT